MRASLRTGLLTSLVAAAVAAGCSSKPLQDVGKDAGDADCTGLAVPTIACLVGPSQPVCALDANGRAMWIILCPGNETGGSTGAGGRGGEGGAPGAGGSGGTTGADGGVGDPCPSTQSCASGLICTTEDGDCKSPPGCGPNVACPAVCYGTCRLPSCKADSECKVEADYCTGCDCRALGAKQSVPPCNGPGVACLIDPCFNKTARCVNGGCVAQ